MEVAHGDFETRSCCELKSSGLDNYSKHESTSPWCMAWAIGDEEPNLWIPGAPFPLRLQQHLDAGGIFVAHNAVFELSIWNNCCVPKFGWKQLDVARTRCTMAAAYSMALPGSLEKAAAAVGIKEQKDLAGGRVMMKLAKPRSIEKCPNCIDYITGHPQCGECSGHRGQKITWWDDPKQLEILYEYCRQDVRVERELDKRLIQLSTDEQRLWQLDYKINQRGVYVDREAIKKAVQVVQHEQDRLNQEMRRVTGNFVGFCTEAARLTKWVQSRGVPVDGIAKDDVVDALEIPELPPDVRRALLLRQEAGRSSTAKLSAMIEAASADGRLRGTLQYHGASTGRWAGRRVQLHNLPRPQIKHHDIEHAIEVLQRYDVRDAAEWLRLFHDSPLAVISSALRSMLRAAPGHELMAADFANIEGRGLAWLAGEEWKLDAFRDYDAGKGPDLYLVAAERIYGREIKKDDPERQIGKVAELACGYQGGVGAFQTMAKTYLVKVPDDQAEEIKVAWRAAHPATVQYWYALEDAAVTAVMNPGGVWTAGPPGRAVAFKVKGSFLWCRLPSGRVLCYPYPKIKPRETPWGEMKDCIHYMTVNGTTNKWEETHTYGGKLSENITQAICRDLLAAAIVGSEDSGFPVVLHVHDEVVSEVPTGSRNLADFEATCSRVPAWASGLPVVAKGWCGNRYRK